MATINVNNIATESKGKDFAEFVDNFQENIQTLEQRQAISISTTAKEYLLDADGYIVGDNWSETIASEIMDLNGFIATSRRIEILILGREIFKAQSITPDHTIISKTLGITAAEFLKLFPKYPIIYFTRWSNLKKPYNLVELLSKPILK